MSLRFEKIWNREKNSDYVVTEWHRCDHKFVKFSKTRRSQRSELEITDPNRLTYRVQETAN